MTKEESFFYAHTSRHTIFKAVQTKRLLKHLKNCILRTGFLIDLVVGIAKDLSEKVRLLKITIKLNFRLFTQKKNWV